MLVNLKSLLILAKRKKVIVPAFKVSNLDILESILKCGVSHEAPVVLSVDQKFVSKTKLGAIAVLVSHLTQNNTVPVVLHLENCSDLESGVLAVKAGFTSISFRGEELNFTDHIKAVRQIVKIAGICGVSVEAVLDYRGETCNYILGDNGSYFSQLEEAKLFVEQTGVDILGLLISSNINENDKTIHWLEDCTNKLPVPVALAEPVNLVQQEINQLINIGITKVPVDLEGELLKGLKRNISTIQQVKQIEKLTAKMIQDYLLAFGTVGKFSIAVND